MKTPIHHYRRIEGFSLVELMVALAIGLFLSGVIASLYLTSRSSFVYQDALSRIQESGRFAIETMARDIRMAGYSACGTASTDPNQPLAINNVINGGGTGWEFNLATGVVGYDNLSGGSAMFPNAVAGTDAFYVIGAGGDTELTVISHNANAATIQTTQHSIKPGAVLLITDCDNTALFQMSGPTNNNGNATNIDHNTGNGISPGNCTKYLGASCPTATAYQYKAGALIMQLFATSYFIAPSQIANNGNSLWSCSLAGQTSGAAQCNELVTGVENMQVLYGLETNNARNQMSTRTYLDANGIGAATSQNWQRVTSMQVSLLLASPPSAGNLTTAPQQYKYNGNSVTAPDRRLYLTFSSLVTLRNRAQ